MFGTPIGAGPGRDSENVGFFADGTPFPAGSFSVATVLPCLGLAGCLGLLCVLPAPPLDDGCSLRLEPVGVGVVIEDDELLVVELEPLLLDDDEEDEDELEDELEEDDPEVELELEGEEELVVVLDEEVGVELVVVVVSVGVVRLDVDERSAQTGVRVAATGSVNPVAAMIWSTVALSGTGTVTSVPVTGSENVTEQLSSAEAVGSAARPNITRTALANASTKLSLRRRLFTAALLL